MHPWASAEIFPGDNVEILLILFRLLTMTCKWTFTKRFTFSTPLACLVGSQFSIICLKCFLQFSYQNAFSFNKLPNILFSEHYLQITHDLKTISTARTTWRQSSMILRSKTCGVMKIFVADFFQTAHIDRDQGHFNMFVTKYCILCNLTPLELPYNALT